MKIVDGVLISYDIAGDTLEVPDGVVSIRSISDDYGRYYVFKKVSLPASLENINAEAFVECNFLEEIELRGENKKYYVTGNSLIERETGTLVLGTRRSEIPTDGSVTRIGPYAFGGTCESCVFIPKCIEWIGENAFYFNCDYKIFAEAEKEPETWDEDWCPIGITEDQIWWEAGDPDIVIYWGCKE